ncbi:hypothetical protein [Streptococcus sp. X16XC17]|uniref:hypothetical protein n=1 Tax=Streptococcus sp. X16XC17 TaxID=2316646 RepID=UPI00066FC058|nr:hypothetical protein [Streptococcus sp. X16XC17]
MKKSIFILLRGLRILTACTNQTNISKAEAAITQKNRRLASLIPIFWTQTVKPTWQELWKKSCLKWMLTDF